MASSDKKDRAAILAAQAVEFVASGRAEVNLVGYSLHLFR